ncbi:hypothetical protein ACQ9A1_23865, partial [Escherichia coli]|uniref:hypothetical protein n=1 Tax=Escherichia coli TaxID=562 RepID=UPI003D36E9D1
DRNRSHWSTSKTPSYTKSVSWQHHLPSVIRKRRTGILINIISLGTGGYNQYDELNIIFFIRII